MPAITILPLDLKGTKLTNRIADEQRTLVQVDNKPHRVLLPRHGAFYNDSNLRIYDGARRLVFGTDYTTTYLYRDLSNLASRPIYAFIIITNAAVSNNVTLNYHAVGGAYGVNVEELKALLDAINPDNYRVDWEDVVNKPKGFNPAPHLDEYWQLYGADNTVTVLNRVRDLLAKNDDSIVQSLLDYATNYYTLANTRLQQEKDLFKSHVEDFNNPHGDDKFEVGLGNLNNWRMVTIPEALNATLDVYYATPESGLYGITQTLTPDLNQHVARRDNPHGIRAQDVGAYTRVEIDTRLVQRLHRDSPSANSNLLFGYSLAGWKAYVTANMNADLINNGYFSNTLLGGGGGSNATMLLGNGTWKNWVTAIAEINATVSRAAILYVRTSTAGYNTQAAINYLNANFANIANYPEGTKAVFMGYNVVYAHSTWYLPEVKFLIRTAGGWAAWLV
jgi:hypothetical protein